MRVHEFPNKDHHPCFNENARHTYARVHLPVAPACNIQCRFCNRLFSCLNENRPGVTSKVLTPAQALFYLDLLTQKLSNISVVGIAGPGDAFANGPKTMETLRLIRERYPKMLFCIASNGLNLPAYIDELVQYNTTHITVTINAVDPKVGAKIYRWVRDGRRVYRGEAAAELLMMRQLESVQKLSQAGVDVKVNSIIIPGVNDQHIPAIAETVAALGAHMHNCMALVPVAGTEFEDAEPPSSEMVQEVRDKSGVFIKQMMHCGRCRADAAGLLAESSNAEDVQLCLERSSVAGLHPSEKRPYIAVATSNGVHVNEHLGKAQSVSIYQDLGGRYSVVEVRKTPPEGGGDTRWERFARILHDCWAIVVGSVGRRPMEYLQDKGIKVYESGDMIVPLLDKLFQESPERLDADLAPQGCPGPRACGFATGGCSTESPSQDAFGKRPSLCKN